jgi:hypothetical protein
MRHIVLSVVASLAPPHISTLSQNGTIFGKKYIEHKMCVLIFSTTFLSNISHSKKNSDRNVTNVKAYSCEVPDIPAIF